MWMKDDGLSRLSVWHQNIYGADPAQEPDEDDEDYEPDDDDFDPAWEERAWGGIG